MAGRLLEKVLRTLPSQKRPILGGNKNKREWLTPPLFCVSNVTLSNNSHTSPFVVSGVLNSESDLFRQRTFGKSLSTISNVKLTTEVPTVNMGSILEHHKYKEMKSKLSKMNRKSLRPLDTASLYILSFKDLTVNLELLSLDALSTQSHSCPSQKGYAEIKGMKQRGAVKKGKLNKVDEDAIEKRFETLLAETGLDKVALTEELFAANKGRRYNWDKEKEQLIVKAYYAIKQQ